MSKFRWLHLSDIHFQKEEQYLTQKMRDELIYKVRELTDENKINSIFITGDLAFRGGGYNENLEEFIKQLLEATNLNEDKLFIVPGNHDLKRVQARKLLIDGARNATDSLETMTVDTLKSAFTEYNIFYNKLNSHDGILDYTVCKCNDVNVFMMNTALTAGTDEDEGKLFIDKETFYKKMRKLKTEENKINIAIGHHPIDWFTDKDQKVIRHNFTDNNIDLYLCGHVHRAGYDYDLNDRRMIQSFNCGIGKVDSYGTVTFLLGEIDLDKKNGEITYYMWRKEDECWIVGGADGRRAADGKAEVKLERFIQENVCSQDIDEDEFRRFIMEFHGIISKGNVKDSNIDPKDVFDKFQNMKCNKSIIKKYDSYCRYFPVINDIMQSSLLSQIEKESIPNIIITEYDILLGKVSTGTEILEGIVQNLFERYSSQFSYSDSKLKVYLKIVVYWSIYECDIFNEVL